MIYIPGIGLRADGFLVCTMTYDVVHAAGWLPYVQGVLSVSLFPGLNLHWTFPAQRITTAGYYLNDLSVDDLSDLQMICTTCEIACPLLVSFGISKEAKE